MGRNQQGFITRKGLLNELLSEVCLTRKELSELINVSVRTVHNIEHGRKAVRISLLEQIADVINHVYSAKYPNDTPLGLTAEYFVKNANEKIAQCYVNSIAINSPRLLFLGDDPIAHSEIKYELPGAKAGLKFAGQFKGLEIFDFYESLSSSLEVAGIPGVEMLRHPTRQCITVKNSTLLKHHQSPHTYLLNSYTEVEIRDGHLIRSSATYDSDDLASFLKHGVAR